MMKPRRVHRRLLLPPGWVALGFLLLLGCQALQPWAKQLKLQNALQLTMPPLRLHQEEGLHYAKSYIDLYRTPAALNNMRCWQNAAFKGEELSDFFNATITEAAIRNIIADTSHAGGVRVRFLPGATYTNLVRVLDIMHHTNQKKYWLDIRHSPTTLYAITDEPVRGKSPISWVCGTRYAKAHPLPKKIGFQEILAEFWKESLVLASQPWQAIAWWLAIIGSLSLRQLFQLKLGRRDS
jgi:hypothetical protein